MTELAGLTFEAEAHKYYFRGRRAPGVTGVLEPYNDLEFVDPDHLAVLAEFGNHVHDAIHLSNIGELDWQSLDDKLLPYIEAWWQYLADSGGEVVHSEFRVYSAKYHYAGCLDSIVDMSSGRGKSNIGRGMRNVLTDIKTGSCVPRTVGPQTAAYNEAFKEMTGRRKMARRCVHLDPARKGRPYNVIPLDDPRDWDRFKAALTLHKWEHGE